MAVRYSYDDATTKIRTIGDTIFNIDFTEAALLQLLDFNESNLTKIAVKGTWPSTKLEWMNDVNTPFTTLVVDNPLTAGATTLNVTTGTGKYFRKGDILGIYVTTKTSGQLQEKVLVTAVATDALTIVRGYGATSGTEAAQNTGVVLTTRAMPENSIYTTEHITTPSIPYNYTQILDASVEMSRTEMKTLRHGIDNHFDMQVAKLFDDNGQEGRLAQLLHRTFYWGERVERDASNYGSMGGFNQYVTAATTSADHVFSISSAGLLRSHIHRVLRAIRTSGGRCTHLITGAWGFEKVRDLYEHNVSIVGEQRVVGAPEVDEIVTPHGRVRLVFDWMCDESEYYFVNADKCGWVPFDMFKRSTVYGGEDNNPYDGRIDKVLGEYTFFLATPKCFGKIYDVSVTK